MINLPTLGAATFPYPSFIPLPPVPIPNPTFNPVSGFDWLMSGPWLPQVYSASVNTINTSSETIISSSLAMTQVKTAQAIKRLDVTGFIVKNRNINFTWENPEMLAIPETIKQLYGLETNYTFSNAQALDELGEGLIKNSADGTLSIASAGIDYVTPLALEEETAARIEGDSALETSIVAVEAELQGQIAAITGYGSLALLTEFLVNLGWTTGYSEYLWSKYNPIKSNNAFNTITRISYDASHVVPVADFKPCLMIESYDSSILFANDLFPISTGLFGRKQQLGYVTAREGFIWQSHFENNSSNAHYRFPKNFGMYYVGQDEGQIGWNRKEILLMNYDYASSSFSFEKKVEFKNIITLYSGHNSDKPSNPTKGDFWINLDAMQPSPGPTGDIQIFGTSNQINVTRVDNIFSISLADNTKLPGNSFTKIACGNREQRPFIGEEGMIRYLHP